MEPATHKATCRHGVTFLLRLDLANAASAILYRFDDEDDWSAAPFQTADAKHDALEAARLITDWLFTEGGDGPALSVQSVLAITDNEE